MIHGGGPTYVIEKGGGSYPRAGPFKQCRKRVWETSEPVISPSREKVFSARRYNDRGG